MGLTEHHWFEDEEEARRWLEEGKEKKMVVYDAYYEASNYGLNEDFAEYSDSIGLYKSYGSAFSSIQNFVKASEDLMPCPAEHRIPNDCIYAAQTRDKYDMLWDYEFYIKEREVLD